MERDYLAEKYLERLLCEGHRLAVCHSMMNGAGTYPKLGGPPCASQEVASNSRSIISPIQTGDATKKAFIILAMSRDKLGFGHSA